MIIQIILLSIVFNEHNMRALGLEYGAIDMKLTSHGQYYFLEINPAGQVLFIEKLARLPISQALARHLLQGIKRH